MARAGAKRQHGSAYALALALQLGGQGLLFRPIERTNALKKWVMGEGNHLANELADLTKAGEQKRAIGDRDWKEEGRAASSKTQRLGSGEVAGPEGGI